MKNLKKLTRKEQEKINGGTLQKCTDHSQCYVGWCCNRMCVAYACIEE
ncbi:hypothetical protein [uncultured Chryseobacterium sp.]|nr:hypothetical protein [uncultured Chryseobacterium sp.]